MSKYIKLFEEHTDYEAFIEGGDITLPNVSHCKDVNDVHYNPLKPFGKIKIDKTSATYKVMWEVYIPKFDISKYYRGGLRLILGIGKSAAMSTTLFEEGEWYQSAFSPSFLVEEKNNIYHIYSPDWRSYHKSWGFDEIHIEIDVRENSDSETVILYDVILEQEDVTPVQG